MCNILYVDTANYGAYGFLMCINLYVDTVTTALTNV
jgi:hypothetical protein